MQNNAEICFEQNEGFTPGAGGHGYERVGFKVGNRCVFVGINYFPDGGSDPTPRYEEARALSEEVVKRWNSFEEYASKIAALNLVIEELKTKMTKKLDKISRRKKPCRRR